jgi:hypothetical protein
MDTEATDKGTTETATAHVDEEQVDQPSTAPAAGGSRRPPLWVLASAGIVAGVLLGLAAAALVARDDDPTGAVELAPVETIYPDDQAANAEAFLESWARHRTATYRAELLWSRQLANGQRLEVSRTVLQQPPQRAVRQAGSTTVVGADASMACEPRGEDTVCTQLPGVDYNREVATEIAAWRTAIVGENPPYAIDESGDGCFELRLVGTLVDPPYGELSQVCFDEATGAMRSRQVVGATATEIEEATAITATVTEADWQEIRG